jgi:hypothetical protein
VHPSARLYRHIAVRPAGCPGAPRNFSGAKACLGHNAKRQARAL